MNSSTRGLDSSTALEFVRALRIATDALNITTVVSIYQASELLYKLFNKVCVINQGRMIYYGPADVARQYFEEMGYEPALRQTTADFLVAVTDELGRTTKPGWERRVPRTPDEMVAYFERSHVARRNRDEASSYLTEMGHPVPPALSANLTIADTVASEVLPSDEGMSNRTSLADVSGDKDAKARLTRAYLDSTKAERAKHMRQFSDSP